MTNRSVAIETGIDATSPGDRLMNRAWSTFEMKSFEDGDRSFEGIASTPETDRMGDIVEPAGAKFTLPIPLMSRHGKGGNQDPIGWVTDVKVTSAGIYVKGRFAKIDAPPSLKEDVDRAYALSKSGLTRGLSIGFKTLKKEPIRGTFAERFTSWEWVELSTVPIAANASASITNIKSADSSVLAASGTPHREVVRLGKTANLPGDSGPTKSKGKFVKKTIAEQIADFENKRAASEARQTEIMSKSADEGRTLEENEEQEYDTLATEVKSIDSHLVRLKAHEQQIVSRAKPVTPENTDSVESASRTRSGVVSVTSNLPKGTVFARYVMLKALTNSNNYEAAERAKSMYHDSTPELELILRAESAAATTTHTTWAAPLIPAAQNMQSEFLELLRPATIVGRIPGLRRVPFNIAIPTQTGGGLYNWVGEGAAKPVGQLAFSSTSLRWAKVAGIIVLTKEVVKFSNPAAEAIVRDDMVKGVAQFIDTRFVDPSYAEVSNVSPASITNGVTPTAASGTTAAAFTTDMKAMFANFITANDGPGGLVILMSESVALGLSLLLNPLGQPSFPDIGLAGGTILGIPVIVSQAVGARVIVLKANEILLADDGGVEIDASDQASLQMNTTPGEPAGSPVTNVEMVSLWQRNYIGLRAERFITWKKARTTAVSYISNAAYG